MPPPSAANQRYVPGLDGLRAVAVVAVITYHLGVSWAPGGMLGVGVFFTLSGYLITDLLLAGWRRRGDLDLRRFWVRRARRLLPALFLMLAAVCVYVAIFDAGQLTGVRRQAIAAALYVGNWSTITQHGSYFANFAAPLPLDHLWSLAIEEQFYLLWPWLLLAGIWTLRRRSALVLATLVLAAASVIAMSHLYQPGYDPTRAYEGTDTRAFGLLVGAALAMVRPAATATATDAVRKLLDTLAVIGLVGIAVLVWRTSALSSFIYPDGLLLLTVATAAVLAAVVTPGSRLGAGLGWAPLRWVGVRSYGIYLWQWPIIVFLSNSQGRIGFVNAVIAIALTVVIASLSWRYVEDPIRHGALGRGWSRFRSAARPRRLATSGAGAVVLVIPLLALAGALPATSHAPGRATLSLSSLPRAASGREAVAERTPLPAVTISTRTSCRSVVYIGDSTSEGEVSTEYIPDPRRRLEHQLANVGVATTYPEISGARSIVETYQGHPNAATVAEQHVSDGFHGCWILALGTNEVDNVHDGSPVGFKERIARMMSIARGAPVMWIDAISLRQSPDPYSEDAMQRWNRALMAACRRYPNMRVFDWASHARERWFISDGIHYTSPGYVHRTHLIAEGLANAFPERGGARPGCLVR